MTIDNSYYANTTGRIVAANQTVFTGDRRYRRRPKVKVTFRFTFTTLLAAV